MATQALCFYCFECLSASFESRDPPTLSIVEELWEEYRKSLFPENEFSSEMLKEAYSEEDTTEEGTGDIEETDEECSTAGDEEEEEEEDQDDAGDNNAHQASTSYTPPRLRPQLPSISRLQATKSSPRSSPSSTPSTPASLSANSSNTALTTAASSTSSFSTSSSNQHPSYSSRLSLTTSYPLFVTWNTHSRTTANKYLRGCIGTFDPMPLSSGLQTYSLTSAFEDTRFSPIHQSLLPSLSCSLTLLANFETCASALDWTLGTHGLRIAFIYRGRRYGATYLPDVAVEQGWSKEETLESLMRKAGWDGVGGGGSGGGGAGAMTRRFLRGGKDRLEGAASSQARPWEEVSDFKVIRYTGLKATATYAEWREWRSWVDENHRESLQ